MLKRNLKDFSKDSFTSRGAAAYFGQDNLRLFLLLGVSVRVFSIPASLLYFYPTPSKCHVSSFGTMTNKHIKTEGGKKNRHKI